jgi:hypothetical protein
MRDEGHNPAFVVELVCLPVPLIVQRDDDAAVEEGELAEPLGKNIEAEDSGFEDLGVWLEGDLRAASFRGAGQLERPAGVPRS